MNSDLVANLKPRMKALRKLEDLAITLGTYLQTKADGEFNLVSYGFGEVDAQNRWGTTRTDLPALSEFTKTLKKQGIRQLQGLAELYLPGQPLPELKKAFTRAPDKIQLGFFQLRSVNGSRVVNDWSWQMEELTGWLHGCSRVHVLPYRKVENMAEAKAFWREWVEQRRYEGVVARNAQGVFKIKPEATLDAAVIAVNKRDQFAHGRVTSLRLALMAPDGRLVHIGDVSSGLDPSTGYALHAYAKHCRVHEDREAVYLQPLIVEVRFFDVYPGERRTWRWDGSRYLSGQPMSFFSLKSPVVLRFRTDKKLTSEDLPLDQIPDAA